MLQKVRVFKKTYYRSSRRSFLFGILLVQHTGIAIYKIFISIYLSNIKQLYAHNPIHIIFQKLNYINRVNINGAFSVPFAVCRFDTVAPGRIFSAVNLIQRQKQSSFPVQDGQIPRCTKAPVQWWLELYEWGDSREPAPSTWYVHYAPDVVRCFQGFFYASRTTKNFVVEIYISSWIDYKALLICNTM